MVVWTSGSRSILYILWIWSKPDTHKKCSRNNISNTDLALINYIVEKIRVLKPWGLTEDVHRKGHAYDIIYDDGLGNHRVIPKDLIKKKG